MTFILLQTPEVIHNSFKQLKIKVGSMLKQLWLFTHSTQCAEKSYTIKYFVFKNRYKNEQFTLILIRFVINILYIDNR